VLEGATSTSAPVQSGVPQGSVLGPLFLLFINDLPEVISTGSTVRLFADDCILYRRIRSTEDINALQDDLNSLQNWERDWLMEFHPEKAKSCTSQTREIHSSIITTSMDIYLKRRG
jgi:hypothetical protein